MHACVLAHSSTCASVSRDEGLADNDDNERNGFWPKKTLAFTRRFVAFTFFDLLLFWVPACLHALSQAWPFCVACGFGFVNLATLHSTRVQSTFHFLSMEKE